MKLRLVDNPSRVVITSVVVVAVMAFLALAGSALAETPVNDDFANALNLGSGATANASGTTADSTVEEGEPQPWATLAGSVWFKWTAPADAGGKAVILRICRTNDFGGFYGINQVYTGTSLGNLVARSNPETPYFPTEFVGRFTGLCATFWLRGIAGETYFIQVGNEDGYPQERDDFELSLRAVKPPKNDLRRNAIKIKKKKLPLTLKANLRGAFGEPGEEEHFDRAMTVWYHFKPVKGAS